MTDAFNLNELAQYDEASGPVITPLFKRGELSAYLLGVCPGQSTELHHHHSQQEIINVVEGRGTVWLYDEPIEVEPGTSLFVPTGAAHRLENTSDTPWLLHIILYERRHLCDTLNQAADRTHPHA